MPAFNAMLEQRGGRQPGRHRHDRRRGDRARAQAQRFIDAGATELAIREAPGTPEEAERTRAFLKSLLAD